MLRQLRIQNYRGFKDRSITVEPTTVVVGKNNAGKSSVVEAMRLVAAVVNRKGGSFTRAPTWVGLSRYQIGITPAISDLGMNLSAVFHRYGDPAAIIKATFEGGAVVTVYLGAEEAIFATIEENGSWVTGPSRFVGLRLPWISVLPQIGPLLAEERKLADDTLGGRSKTRLSSRHFRNQLNQLGLQFDVFKALAEETWRGLSMESIQETTTKDGVLLTLLIRDGDFAAEVGLMGHGLQMWLQTIWFLSKTPVDHSVVLDEPDVYMHPDLQRKLFRLARDRFAQCIIATHSVEVMAEADPSEILIVDKKERRSRYANDEPGVQLLIDQLGGIHNVHLARLWSAGKFLLVEGNDISLLKRFHSLLCPDSDLPLDTIPSFAIGGWSAWQYALGSSSSMKNAVGERIVTYCILDSDYHSDIEILERYQSAQSRGINLHVWARKEIENYLIQPQAIRRALVPRLKGQRLPSEVELRSKILEICEGQRRAVEDGVADALMQANRGLEVSTANKAARACVGESWCTEDNRPQIVSGKFVLSRLSEWFQERFGASIGAPAITRHMTAGDIPREMIDVIEAIEEGKCFPSFDDRAAYSVLHIIVKAPSTLPSPKLPRD